LLEKAMQQTVRGLQFEEAAVLRDRIRGIKENLLFGVE
jgi:uvrABC system protein B